MGMIIIVWYCIMINLAQLVFGEEESLITTAFGSNSNASYSDLSSSSHGRHLLLISLLEEVNQPYWYPRSSGYVKLSLPSSLASPDQPPATSSSLLLKPVRDGGGKSMSREDIISKLNDQDDFLLLPGKKFTKFNKEHSEVERRLVKMLTEQNNFDSMFSMLVVMKEFLRTEVFVDIVYSLIQRRKDVGFIIPSDITVQPFDYFNADQLLASLANDTSSSHKVKRQAVSWARGHVVDVYLDSSQYQTLPDSEPESRLWYFREDPLVNANHFHWHQVLSNDEVMRDDPMHSSNLDRRGEMFYFMHRQLLCRENLERLCVGLDVAKPYGPKEWYEPLYPGYDPKLGFGSTKRYVARPPGAIMFPSDARKLKRYEEILRQDIDWGFLAVRGGYVKLEYVDGEDRGISTLGDFIESYIPSKYGDLHNTGHTIISDLHFTRGDGIMGTPNVAFRDPIFSRWHKYIDDIFLFYKNKFGPYSDKDLDFLGVKISSLTISTDGTHHPTIDHSSSKRHPNILYTYMNKDARVQLNSLDLTKAGSSSVMIHYTRLDNVPFVYNLKIESSKQTAGMVRIFLIPANIPRTSEVDVTQLAVELDRFHVQLSSGVNTLVRKSVESSFVSKKRKSLHDLQRQLMSGHISKDEFNWGGCGWPMEMLLPRGKEEGMKFDLFVVLSPLLDGDVAHTADWRTHNTGTWSWCGVRSDQGGMPDSRPMGFPLDRSPPNGDWKTMLRRNNGVARSNMASLPVVIVHQSQGISSSHQSQGVSFSHQSQEVSSSHHTHFPSEPDLNYLDQTTTSPVKKISSRTKISRTSNLEGGSFLPFYPSR